MKIHLLSNAPWSATGYGAQIKLFIPHLQALGHELTMTAFYGLEGAPLTWKGVKCYPRGFHPYGQDIVGANAAHAKADIILSLMDAWVCEPNLYGKTPWAAWFPIDSEPVAKPVLSKVAHAFSRIVYSEFGAREMDKTGMSYHYVPHGVDTEVFKPMGDQREMLGWPKDRFIVGMVAANKGNPSRKAFAENITAFRQLQLKHPDAWLYLHTFASENGENQGVNLIEFMDSLGMERGKDYGLCDQYNYMMSFPESYMAAAYSSMDVHLLVSMGEGFGVPILEAQACGTPVIVGDWTSMGELCFAGWKVAKEDAHKAWNPLASYQYSPNPDAIAEKLELAYKTAASYRKEARKGAVKYDAAKVADKYWRPVLNTIAEQIEDSKRERKWAKVGVNEGYGVLQVPSTEAGDAASMWVYPDGRKMVRPDGFEMEFNGVKLDIEDDPDGGVAKVVMKEIASSYDLDRDFKDGDVIVDIGAHVGVVSCYLGKKYPQTKIYAFEPLKANYERAKRNIEANCVKNVDIYWNAITGDGRVVNISTDTTKNSGGNNIYTDAGEETITYTLEQVFNNHNMPIDRIRLLKLDCEGAEYEIIEANPELLKRVDAVRGELHPMPGKDMQQLFDLIKSYVPDTKMTFLGGKE